MQNNIKFEKISIIGCGLIGSSILRNINKKEISRSITVFDKSKEVIDIIKKEKLCDEISRDIPSAVKDSDLIILCVPLSSYKEILLSAKDHFKENAIITDTGSVKKEVNRIFENFNFKKISWLASHPIAGTEESGPAAGFRDLFKDRWTIICEGKDSQKDKVEKLKKFWEFLGSKVKLMSFEDHDHILALTSHLPHAVAYNIVMTAIDTDDNETPFSNFFAVFALCCLIALFISFLGSEIIFLLASFAPRCILCLILLNILDFCNRWR